MPARNIFGGPFSSGGQTVGTMSEYPMSSAEHDAIYRTLSGNTVSFSQEYNVYRQGTTIRAEARIDPEEQHMTEVRERLISEIRDKLYAEYYGIDGLETLKSLETKVHLLEMEIVKLKQKDSK